MKTITTLLLSAILVLISLDTSAQYVSIPDTAFGRFMKNAYPTCITGSSGSGWLMDTTCSAITNFGSLSIYNNRNIHSVSGLEYFDRATAMNIQGCDSLTSIAAFPRGIQSITIYSSPMLTSLPALPSSLLTLSCSAGLTSLPPLPAGLRELYCPSNKLTVLPALPASLIHFNCNYNLLTALPALPNSITELRCESNFLSSLPTLPTGLDSLYCGHNQLTSIPAVPSFLVYLSCPYNLLTSLPSLPPIMGTLEVNNNHGLTCIPPLDKVWALIFDSTSVTCLTKYPVDAGGWYFYIHPDLSTISLCSAGNPHGCAVAPYGLAGPDQTICIGDTVHMAASGSGTWTASAGNTFSSIVSATSPSTPILYFQYPGIYRYMWTTSTGPDTVEITVQASSSVSITRDNRDTVCSGILHTFSAVVADGSNPSYQWYHHYNFVNQTGAILIPGAQTSTYSATFTGNDTLLVICTCTNSCGRQLIVKDFVAVYVNQSQAAPSMAATGTCLPDTLSLGAQYGNSRIDWYSAGTPVSSFTNYMTAAGGNGVGSAANQLAYPSSVFVDATGNIYVTDEGNTRIVKFPAGSTSATAGTVVAGGNGIGSAANQFNFVAGLTVDPAGNIYVADQNNHRIMKFPAGSSAATNGVIVAGGNGQGNAANQFLYPQNVSLDAAGNLYVADGSNQRVQKFPAGSTSATNGITVAGGNGTGTAGNQFSSQIHILTDPSGNLYVSDRLYSRVQRFPAGSTSATNGVTIAGAGIYNYGNGANQLDGPLGMYLDAAGYLYVADAQNNRVQKFPPGSTLGTAAVTIAGGGHVSGVSDDQLSVPFDVSGDAAGNIYIADRQKNRILKISQGISGTQYLPTAAGTYTARVTATNGCISPLSNTITVNICLSDSVWPGDADHNGVADNNDLLPIGIGYGLNGFARPDQSIVWSAHSAQDWGMQFLSGTNAKHADCNGDAVIDANDTTAIMANFGLTHSKTGDYGAPWRSGIPGLTLRFSKDTVAAGDTLTVSLILGDSVTTVSDLYGLAFTYHYDALVVDSTSTSFGFINSFIGNSTDKISIHKDFKTNGIVKAAVTGINHVGRSGHGEIARFIAAITTGNINGKDLSYYGDIHYISDITAIDKDGHPLSINAGTDSNQVAYEPTGISDISYGHVLIYPNPAKDAFTIKTDAALINTAYTLSDIAGRVILFGRITRDQTVVSIADIATGIYILQLGDQKQCYKIIKN